MSVRKAYFKGKPCSTVIPHGLLHVSICQSCSFQLHNMHLYCISCTVHLMHYDNTRHLCHMSTIEEEFLSQFNMHESS